MPYRLSFTAVSFRFWESIRVAELYAAHRDWRGVRDEVLAEDVLRLGRPTNIRRKFSELALRLQTLSEKELQFLVRADSVSQRQLLLVAICRTYPFVRHFVRDVLRRKHLLFDNVLRESDYREFYDREVALHEELERLTESTRRKVREVLFKILEGAGYLRSVQDKTIVAPLVLPELTELIRSENRSDLALFLLPDRDL